MKLKTEEEIRGMDAKALLLYASCCLEATLHDAPIARLDNKAKRSLVLALGVAGYRVEEAARELTHLEIAVQDWHEKTVEDVEDEIFDYTGSAKGKLGTS